MSSSMHLSLTELKVHNDQLDHVWVQQIIN